MPQSESRLFISDCGQYIARATDRCAADFDVMAIDGSQLWLGRRYEPKGFNDTDPRYTHPEFEHMVTGFHNLSRKRGGLVFSLSFADTDQSKRIDPGKGNCIVRKYEATFSRPLKIRRAKVIQPKERK